VSYGFPIINFCNPGVHYETPCIISNTQKSRKIIFTQSIQQKRGNYPRRTATKDVVGNMCLHSSPGRLQLKCDATRWRREGTWRGNWRMEWVASTLHTTSEHGVSSIITADAHNSAASSRLNWRPRRFKWSRPFGRKTKCGLCACAITFQLASNKTPAMVRLAF